MSLDVERVSPLTYTAMQVTDEYLNDIFMLIGAAKKAGLWQGEGKPVNTADGEGGWLVTIIFPSSHPSLFAHPGYWIIADHEMGVEVFDPVTVSSAYHKNVDFNWDATTVAPTAVLNTDGSVTLAFRQPLSINGPFSYTFARTEVSSQASLPVTTSGDPVASLVKDESHEVGVPSGRIIGADITVTFPPGLTEGVGVTFTVTATDAYGKTATSLPTDTLTLTPPDPAPGA